MKKLTDKELSLFLGKDFLHGTNDCYSLISEFYQVAFNIELTNYARPDFWWNAGMDLYNDFYILEAYMKNQFKKMQKKKMEM